MRRRNGDIRLNLEARDHALLDGDAGDAAAFAMKLLMRVGESRGAERFIDITCAHIDSCLWHGQAGLDFAERLADQGGRVAVPATLNVSSLDLLHPDLFRGDDNTARRARRLMDAYVGMGCEPTWTCAPYQLPRRPAFGEHIAWAESNAIVFANSVLGARTDRYGDFIDICAALTGRVPDAGLHCTENRRGEVVFDVHAVPARLFDDDAAWPVLGHRIGRDCGTAVPVIVGLPADVHEDRLKALGAAAASSGAVALFHAVGVTPEARTLEDALHGRDARTVVIDMSAMRAARDELSTDTGRRLVAVSLGTPHFSVDEFRRLVALIDGERFAHGLDVWISTARHTLAAAREHGLIDAVEAAGARVVTDTCTYITPILRSTNGVVMTNSAKWAWYAPGNLGVDVAFGSTEDCVRSAIAGRIVRDDSTWRD